MEIEHNKQRFLITYYWMYDELGLLGTDLNVFAVLYSFTKDGKGYYGSIDNLARLSFSSRRSTFYSLKHLLELGFIIKEKSGSRKTGGLEYVYKTVKDDSAKTALPRTEDSAKTALPMKDESEDSAKTALRTVQIFHQIIQVIRH